MCSGCDLTNSNATQTQKATMAVYNVAINLLVLFIVGSKTTFAGSYYLVNIGIAVVVVVSTRKGS